MWQQLRTNAARYAEAGLLMSMEDHAGALAVLQAMAQERPLRDMEEAERGRMAAYIEVLQAAANDERDACQLDTAEV